MPLWKKKKKKEENVVPQGPVPNLANSAEQVASRHQPTEEASDHGQLGMFILEDKPSQKSKVVDIIAIHGLNGHYRKTWTVTTASGERINWLEDLLPKQIPSARIMSYGYNSAVQFSKSVADIGTFAEQLLNDLLSWRNSPAEKLRPIIFICHSLGGIVFKQALNRAHERERFTGLLAHIRGVAFFGTPHRGSDLARWTTMFANILEAASFGTSTNAKLSKELKSHSETLCQISKSFVERGKELVIFSFYETDKWKKLNCRIVEEDSATLGWSNETTIAINGNHRTICRFSAIDEPRYRNVWVSIQSMATMAIDKTMTEEERACYLSLYTSDYESHRNRNPKPVPGTCRWILEHEKYNDWYSTEGSRLLWVSADAGCGKSVLISFLIDLFTKSQVTPHTNVCYFFFKDDVNEQRSAVFALSALIHQICTVQPTLIHHATSQRAIKGHAMIKQFHSLWDIFVATVCDEDSNDTICFIDGLDECEMFSRKELMTALTEFFGREIRKSHPYLKVIVTSRPDNSVKNAFCKLPEIRLRGENETKAINEDVKLVVQASVNNLKSSGLPRDLLTKLQQELIRRADRTFLWTTLTIELLKDASERGASRKEIDRILQSRDIDVIYSRLLAGRPYPTQARRLLQIVLAAARPFTLEEMSIALAVRRSDKQDDTFEDLGARIKHPFENHVKSLCGHFLRIVHERIYLVHQTAREFLLRPESPKVSKPMVSKKMELDQKVSSLARSDSTIQPLTSRALRTAGEFLHHQESLETKMTSKPMEEPQFKKQSIPQTRKLESVLENAEGNTEKPARKTVTWKTSISLIGAHRTLLNICVAYLYLFHDVEDESAISNSDNARSPERSSLSGLLNYAAIYWLSHLRVARTEDLSVWTRWYANVCDPKFGGFKTWTRLNPSYNLYFPPGRIDIQGAEPEEESIFDTLSKAAPRFVNNVDYNSDRRTKTQGRKLYKKSEQQWDDIDSQQICSELDIFDKIGPNSEILFGNDDSLNEDHSDESKLSSMDSDSASSQLSGATSVGDLEEMDPQSHGMNSSLKSTHRHRQYQRARKRSKERDPLRTASLLASHPPAESSFLHQIDDNANDRYWG